METLQQLTHRQVDALRTIGRRQTPSRGASLKEIASALFVSPPSALAHLGPLEELGLISRFRGKSRLTDKGNRTLQEYQRHHRVAETLFGQLGLSPEATCQAAREVDLSISHRTVERVCAAEGHPAVCPHGEPISPCSERKGTGGPTRSTSPALIARSMKSSEPDDVPRRARAAPRSSPAMAPTQVTSHR